KDRSIKGTTGWQNYSVVLDVPEGATDIFIGFVLSGLGALWVNGIKVQVVGSNVPVTDRALNSVTHGPTNLAFDKPQAVGVPEGWFLAGSKPTEYDCALEPGASYGGLPSTYLRSKEGIQTTGFGTLMQQFSASKYLGKRIRLSANLKSDHVKEW